MNISTLKTTHLVTSLALVSLATSMQPAAVTKAARVLARPSSLAQLPLALLAVRGIRQSMKTHFAPLCRTEMHVRPYASKARKPFFDIHGRIINPSATQTTPSMDFWVYDAARTLPNLQKGTPAQILTALIKDSLSHYYTIKSTGMSVDIALTKNSERWPWLRKKLTPEKVLAWAGNDEQWIWWNRKLKYQKALQALGGKPGNMIDLQTIRETMRKSINNILTHC